MTGEKPRLPEGVEEIPEEGRQGYQEEGEEVAEHRGFRQAAREADRAGAAKLCVLEAGGEGGSCSCHLRPPSVRTRPPLSRSGRPREGSG